MRTLEDQEYFAQREREARRMAAEATHASARAVHLRLAHHYARRARPQDMRTEDRDGESHASRA